MLKYLNFSEKTFNKSYNFVHVVSSSVTHFSLSFTYLSPICPGRYILITSARKSFHFVCYYLHMCYLTHLVLVIFPIDFHFTENILYFSLALISIPVNHLSLSVVCLQERSLASISLVVLIPDELFYFEWFQIP